MPEWIDVILRTLLFVIVLFFFTRILGKKQIGQLSLFQFVSAITIGTVAAVVILGLVDRIMYGVFPIAVLALFLLLTDIVSLKSKKFRDIFIGQSTIFIKDGNILEDNLKKERYSLDEINTLLRQKNIFRAADVEFGVIEPTGDISVLLKKAQQPLTPKDVRMNVANETATQSVIMDGEIIYDALASSGKTPQWLDTELAKLDVTLENVFLGQINSYGELTVDIYDDMINVALPQQRPVLNAMLKKCEADFEIFSLSTENQEAKKMYERNAKKLTEVIEKLDPYLNG